MRVSERAAALAHAQNLFSELSTLTSHSPRHRACRDELIEMHLPLVRYLARRFRNRGEPYDDLLQVGTIGLMKAVDHFEPRSWRGLLHLRNTVDHREIKRHLRDTGWLVRPPRQLQELRLELSNTTRELTHLQGRSPTVAELAERLHITRDEVLEALEAAHAYAAMGLDTPHRCDATAPSIADALPVVDGAMEGVEYRESLNRCSRCSQPGRRESCCCGFLATRRKARSPRNWASARCTFHGCWPARSRSCAPDCSSTNS